MNTKYKIGDVICLKRITEKWHPSWKTDLNCRFEVVAIDYYSNKYSLKVLTKISGFMINEIVRFFIEDVDGICFELYEERGWPDFL